MRLKILCNLNTAGLIPYNYNYELQNIIYNLIRKSSPEFSEFLHSRGYITENRPFKLFTFSKMFFKDGIASTNGFSGVSSFELMFSTPIQKSCEHLVLGIFADQEFTLYFSQDHRLKVGISSVESLPEPSFEEKMHFIALSPVVSATAIVKGEKKKQHFLDYINPAERDKFAANLYRNLCRKYNLIHNKEFNGNSTFEFKFDDDYIRRKKGKIRKNIRFKKDRKSGRYSCIIGMEAPFTVKADPALIKVGYQCGFGEKNSAGFGMAELLK